MDILSSNVLELSFKYFSLIPHTSLVNTLKIIPKVLSGISHWKLEPHLPDCASWVQEEANRSGNKTSELERLLC